VFTHERLPLYVTVAVLFETKGQIGADFIYATKFVFVSSQVCLDWPPQGWMKW